ncbi:MAG: FAD:protein FMN transferase [Oscillospiraceae bacterium]|nr:FAD:protein FMN transferase [Oscillospiraceae bacterium]
MQIKIKIIPIILITLFLTGCGSTQNTVQAEEAQTATIFAMDTVMELSVYGSETLLDGAESIILALERELSVTDAESEIYAVNRDGAGSVSADTAELLNRALELCARTDGALDISIYPVVRTWGFTTGEYRVPDSEELRALLECVDYTRISFDGESALSLAEGMEIDLGSVAKGYASSRVIQYWKNNGVTSALLNLGGNVHALGTKPDGSAWRVAIADPEQNGYLGVLEVVDQAVITSGGYERYFEQDGKTYWHIIDPDTGCPAESGLISVTVVGSDGVLCDALSTSLFVMGLDGASALWNESDDFEAVFVTSDDAVYVTEGLADNFSPLGDYEGQEVTVIYRA